MKMLSLVFILTGIILCCISLFLLLFSNNKQDRLGYVVGSVGIGASLIGAGIAFSLT